MARGKGKGRGRGGGRGKPRDDSYRSDLLEKSDMHNKNLFAYYKAQKLVSEDEWDGFIEAMRQPLPTTFRVAGSRQTANSLNTMIKGTYAPSLNNVEFEGQAIPPPVQIPWYPEGLAWQFNVTKKVLRKSLEFKKFHSFLVFETEVGNVSRQEAVSMLPPLFLDVEPHHMVMDMCAAPGSKTAQLLEALHAKDTVTSTSIPSGLLLANDSDAKRTHLLIHQSARLPSPALMVTNLDASNYPSIKMPAPEKRLLFDRILCDVPCSGDGTIRKNLGIWKSWSPADGNGLHGLQLRILERAMKLLKAEGRIVYSTCSLNPTENEAVVAAALRSNSDFHLVDVSEQLPELKRKPGLTTWRPTNDKTAQVTYATYEEFMAQNTETKGKLVESHWPPTNAEELNLSRCLRIYPHLQDTGGFFVAVLERRPPSVNVSSKKRSAEDDEEGIEPKKPKLVETGDVSSSVSAVAPTRKLGPWVMAPARKSTGGNAPEHHIKPAPETETGASPEEANNASSSDPSVAPPSHEPSPIPSEAPLAAADGGGSFKENPYTFLAPDDPILRQCIESLSLTSSFPSSNVLVRNPDGDAARSLYITNDIVRTVIENNDYARLRLTAAGTKVFAKQDASKGESIFRILGEGLPVVLPYVDQEKIIETDLETLKILVESYYPLCERFGQPFRGAVEARELGSHIIRVYPTKEEIESARLTHEIVLPIWKSNVSLGLMVDKKAKSALSLRLFGEDITTTGKQAVAQKVEKPTAPSAATAEKAVEIEVEVVRLEDIEK